MSFAPRQDWDLYRAHSAAIDAAHNRSRTVQQRFALYEDLFRLIFRHRDGSAEWELIERLQWDQKLKRRMELNHIYSGTEQPQHGKAPGNDARRRD